ncbi:MAG: aspartate/glutamate racemase family protein [Theionarchaea archaeon]|nr:aspartate/glutamate racemase family protein [Theionarchaea archaeon]
MHLGLIIPSSNTVMEEELSPFCTVHSTRIPLKMVNESVLKEMNTTLQVAIDLITDCSPDVLMYGCTSGSFIEDITSFFKGVSLPWATTSQAVISALDAIGAQSVSVATPYTDPINEREKQFLESHGFTVTAIAGADLQENREIGRLRSGEVYSLVESLPYADAYFLSCTNMRTFKIIERLEHERRAPVISSNSASLWKALGLVDEGPVEHCGRLLEEFL